MKSKGNSAFLLFQQLDLDFEGSDTEASSNRKDKQRQKKKAKSKKKNTENAELKDLAMLPSSKKSKAKAKAKTATPTSPADVEGDVESPRASAEKVTPVQEPAVVASAPAAAATPVPVAAARSAPRKAAVVAPTKAPRATTAATTSPETRSGKHLKKSPSTPLTDGDSGDDDDTSASASGALGVSYSPTHVTVTSLDGAVSRQVAVHEMMDQLLRFQQQHQQDVMVKEQLQVANRNLAEQLQQGAGLISSLKNEVSMFRQMCLNLQAEVTQLRGASAAPAPFAPAHPSHTHTPPPPPGMS